MCRRSYSVLFPAEDAPVIVRMPYSFLFFNHGMVLYSDGQFDYVDASYADAYPKLVALEKSVADSDVVKKWIASKDS